MATKKGKSDGLVGKKAKPTPKPEKEIGMDTDDKFISAVLAGVDSSQVDLQTLDNFGSTSQARESIYSLIDTMSQDDRVSAVLETYAEDATETNEKGSVIWCESSDSPVADYVSNLLDQLNVDKHAYEWTYTLCKYGDVYLRLYRESDYGNDPVFGFGRKDGKGKLNESSRADEAVSVSIPGANDRYVPYVEMVPNPGEMFELTKFGKTVGYIQAPVMVQNHDDYDRLSSTFFTYRMDRGDVSVYGATDFVHAYLNNDNTTRVPEEVEIFHGDGDSKTVDGTYRVRKGQSLLYNEFRVWRELSLMENTVLLNRITKSALTRILQIEVGDMPQYKVKAVMDFIKSKLEQKTAVSAGQSIQEYTNPGPVENIIYLPTHGGQGAVSAQTLGGDYDPKQLTDLNYFLDKFYGALRVPKQYFSCLRGDTQIALLDGTAHPISEMYEHAEDFVGKGIMACDVDGKLVPTRISEVLLTKPEATFLRIHLDNGEYVDVTEDHRMMLRDGTFVFAKDIKEGDSLMPYYERMNEDGRKEVLDNKEGKYRLQYRVVAESKFDDIPKTNNIHHTDCNKLNDDFDNLENLTWKEHCERHLIDLHHSNRKHYEERRNNGEKANRHVGSKMITNGTEYRYLQKGKEMPDGFWVEGKKKPEGFGETLRRIRTGHVRTEAEKEHYRQTCQKRYGCNHPILTAEQKAASLAKRRITEAKKKEEEVKRQRMEKSAAVKKAYEREDVQRHYRESLVNRHGESRIRKEYMLRCPTCGKVFVKKLFPCEYEAYLKQEKFVFCSEACRSKMFGKGKLNASMKLYHQCGCDLSLYDERQRGNDSLFKASTLKEKLDMLHDYVPEVNHKVTKVEKLDVVEPAYDINVEASCHTFALPCGIFVHNCTDDSTGFNGGSSLSIISSRYGKAVKRIQNAVCQMVSDLVNIFLIDRGLDAYVGKFTIRMQAPITQEELDRRDNMRNRMAVMTDVMSQVDNVVTDDVIKAKISKSLLSQIVADPDVISLLQEQIDSLEAAKKAEEPAPEGGEGPEKGEGGKAAEGNRDGGSASRGALDDFGASLGYGAEGGPEPGEEAQEAPSAAQGPEPQAATEAEPEAESGAEDSYLPSPGELGIDLTGGIE